MSAVLNEGIIKISGNVLTVETVIAIEKGMISRASTAFIAQRVAGSLIKPKWYKVIPYVGWAITIGTTLYVGYEAYNATQINFQKMENETYTEKDMNAFRIGYTESTRAFARTDSGVEARENNEKYILIPAEAMPIIATIDSIGIGQYGNVLTWDPANATTRRAAAIRGRPPAGPFAYANGNVVRGSWEEYPFAATQGPGTGAYVDRCPLRENWIQGGFIRAAAMVQGFTPGDTVKVYILG